MAGRKHNTGLTSLSSLTDVGNDSQVVCCCGVRINRSAAWCLLALLAVSAGVAIVVSIARINYAIILERRTPNPEYPTGMQYGIWWYGKDNAMQKWEPGVPNKFFSANRTKTLLYMHGWAPQHAQVQFLETFNYKMNDELYGVDVNTANAWIDDGWNVGIFYWVCFADEPQVDDAEAKIWTTGGNKGMRWRDEKGTFHTAGAPNATMGQLAASVWADALAPYVGRYNRSDLRLRVAGHSLGNQLAVSTLQQLHQRADNGLVAHELLPDRMVLLDPYYSLGSKSYLSGGTVAAHVTQIVQNTLLKDTVIELLKTSVVSQPPYGDSNIPLKKMVMYMERDATYINELAISSKHQSAPNLYFWSYNFSSVVQIDQNGNLMNMQGPSAYTPNAVVEVRMQSDMRWVQVDGLGTPNPGDDGFQQWNHDHIRLDDTLYAHLAFTFLCTAALVIMLLLVVEGVGFHRMANCITPMVMCFVALAALLLGNLFYLRQNVLTFLVVLYALLNACALWKLDRYGRPSPYIHLLPPRFPVVYQTGSNTSAEVSTLISTNVYVFWICQLVLPFALLLPMTYLASAPFNRPIQGTDYSSWAVMVASLVLILVAAVQRYEFERETQRRPSGVFSQEDSSYAALHNDEVHHDGPYSDGTDAPETLLFEHGVWRYSRHPDLLGELMFWWAAFACAMQVYTPGAGAYNYTSIVGPILLTLLVLFYTIPTRELATTVLTSDKIKLGIWHTSTPLLLPMPGALHRWLDDAWFNFRRWITMRFVASFLTLILLAMTITGVVLTMQQSGVM